jgi:hypothetical protein
MISWQLNVDGSDYVVTVDRGPKEKDLIRVNGRLAGAPLSADELECEVSLGGAAYVIRRDGDSFQLFPGEEQSIPSNPPPTRKPRILKYVVRAGLAGLMIVNLLAGVAIFDQYRAATRVHKLLEELRTSSEMGMLPAMALWSGKPVRLDAMSQISHDFDRWRMESDLYRKKISGYRITRSELDRSGTKPAVIVTFYLDRNLYRVRVSGDAPISWEGTPPQHVDVVEAPPVRKPRVPGSPTKLTFEVLPPPSDPNARPKETTAKPGSMVTFLPRGDRLGRVFVMRPGEYTITIRALSTDLTEAKFVTLIELQTLPLLPGLERGYVTIDGGKRLLTTGKYVPGRDGDALRFSVSLDSAGCTAGGGTLQILALDYDMGDQKYISGARAVYLKRLDATYSVVCGAKGELSTGEIHVAGDTH